MHRLPRLCALAVLLAGCASAPSNPMSFFVTSAGGGKGVPTSATWPAPTRI